MKVKTIDKISNRKLFQKYWLQRIWQNLKELKEVQDLEKCDRQKTEDGRSDWQGHY